MTTGNVQGTNRQIWGRTLESFVNLARYMANREKAVRLPILSEEQTLSAAYLGLCIGWNHFREERFEYATPLEKESVKLIEEALDEAKEECGIEIKPPLTPSTSGETDDNIEKARHRFLTGYLARKIRWAIADEYAGELANMKKRGELMSGRTLSWKALCYKGEEDKALIDVEEELIYCAAYEGAYKGLITSVSRRKDTDTKRKRMQEIAESAGIPANSVSYNRILNQTYIRYLNRNLPGEAEAKGITDTYRAVRKKRSDCKQKETA
jgi:hypothetical protein